MNKQYQYKRRHKLGKASFVQVPSTTNISAVGSNTVIRGYHPTRPVQVKFDEKEYKETAARCRWYYIYDPIAGTVIDRMVDLAISKLTNTQNPQNKEVVDERTMAFFNKVAEDILPVVKTMAIEYLVTGMALPDFLFTKRSGKDISEKMLPKEYDYPIVWVRDIEEVVLEKRPIGEKRVVFFEIPAADISFVETKGIYTDGREDKEGYEELRKLFPEYVRAIEKGVKYLILDIDPIMRTTTAHAVYPIPFLTKALRALEHKDHIRSLDRSVAARAIEAIRHIKVGNDDYPASQDDIDDHKASLVQSTSTYDQIYNWVTNHTIEAKWIIPPLDTLLDNSKYDEVNADIFIGLGFPRVLTAGETLKSNTSDSSIAALGPKSTLENLQRAILTWLKKLYKEVAEVNGFKRYPQPVLPQVSITDFTALVQFAIDAMREGAISKNRVAELYGTDHETEKFYMAQESYKDAPTFQQQLEMQKQTQKALDKREEKQQEREMEREQEREQEQPEDQNTEDEVDGDERGEDETS
jgi:hypothetical protein